MTLRILLADDHGLFRDSMRTWLEQAYQSVHIATAASLQEVEDALQTDPPFDLLLLDLGMPGMRGAISVATLCKRADRTSIIIVSANENPQAIRHCIDCGASGYVPKSASGETIAQSIQLVLDGGIYVPAGVQLARIDDELKFTTKQMRILTQLAEGASNKQIAERLFLTEGTVKQYVSELLKKLNVDNRTQAGIVAREIYGISQN